MGQVKWEVNQETGCWEWSLAISDTGYGAAWNGDKLEPAHRMVYRTIKGEIPEGHDLDHLCRNRKCVNPDHLEPVTRQENAHRGQGTKLSKEQVIEIRDLNASGIGYRKLAKQFGVHRSTICHLITRRNWKEAA